MLYDNLYLYYLVGKLDGYSSNVFKITKDEKGESRLVIEDNDEIGEKVFNEYYKLLDEEESEN